MGAFPSFQPSAAIGTPRRFLLSLVCGGRRHFEQRNISNTAVLTRTAVDFGFTPP
jgi:hypothetical protein